MSHQRNIRLVGFAMGLLVLCCSSCSITRSVPDGQFLFTGAKLEIEKTDPTISSEQLEVSCIEIIKNPQPNKKFLGIPWALHNHNFFYTKKKKGIIPWLRKTLGSPPVIYDEQVTAQIETILKNRAYNNGFFDAEVKSEVTKKKKKAKVNYKIVLRNPYPITTIKNAVVDSLVKEQIDLISDKTLVKPGSPYNLNVLKRERERINLAMRKNGFYFFRPDYLMFRADTLQEERQFHLELLVKDQVDARSKNPQIINEIFVYPDLNTKDKSNLPKDTLVSEGIQFIFRKELIRPSILRDAILFQKGEKYSLKAHQNSLERLSFLNNHKFIEIQFAPVENSDSLLNVLIRLTPRKRDAIEGTVGISLKSGLYLGPELSISYLNRNIFKGAERFRLTTFGNFNFPLVDGVVTQQEQGLSFELSKPGILVPFKKEFWAKNRIATTKMFFTYSSQQFRLPLLGIRDSLVNNNFNQLLAALDLDSKFAPKIALDKYEFTLAYQYRWRPDIRHQLSPINLVLQNPRFESDELKNLFLLVTTSTDGSFLNLDNILVYKPSYTYLYDSRLKKLKTHNFFYQSKSALVISRSLSNQNLIDKEFINSEFLQLENDFRYYYQLSSRQTIAFRFAAKVFIPFREKFVLPFFDLYNVGGPNSIRAFHPRLVGPGRVVPDETSFFFTGTGDLLLESSIEWRPKINSWIELGLFLDAGNVWLLNGNNGENGDDRGTFKFSTFYQQLAIGTGLGLRLDFKILLIRLDIAFPLTKPWLPKGERWVGDKVALGIQSWRKENLTFNLNFGYPF